MKHFFKPVFSLAIFAILASVSVQADSQEQMIIALKTTDFELTETDISELAVGEAKTIETDSGKVIDILRTAEGAEIYIDGELLEMNFDNDGQHDGHMVKKHFEVICEEGQECDENVIVLGAQDHHGLDLVGEHENMIFIHKEVELSCTDDEEGTSCSDEHIWISDGEESEFEALHKMHQDGEGHKLIVIRKEIVTED